MNEDKASWLSNHTLGLITSVIALVIILSTAPCWQSIFLTAYICIIPTIVALLGLILICTYARSEEEIATISSVTVLLVLGTLIAGSLLAGSYMVEDIKPIELDTLPVTADVRYLPIEVAHEITASTLNDPMYAAGQTHPFDYMGEMAYITPRLPNGFNNQLNGNANGAMIIYANGTQHIIDQEFKYGEGMDITDNIYWKLIQKHYLSYVPDVYYVMDENTSELLLMAPYIGYKLVFPCMLPYWKGVMVVHTDGEIEDLSVNEAIADPRFKEQRLYPEYLARYIGLSWGYRNGVWNTVGLVGEHKDQAELANVVDAGNKMPYLMPNGNGFSWVSMFEPYGPSESIYKIMYIDAHDGSLAMYNIPVEKNLGGPARAISYVKTKFLQYDWESGAAAIEPRPIIQNDTNGNPIIYYQVSITNKAFNGMQSTVLVDSRINLNDNKQVLEFANYNELKAFLSSGKLVKIATKKENIPTKYGQNISSMSNIELIENAYELLGELKSRSP